MIVSCPNCGARYRLSAAVVAKGARLKCAGCEHRWAPEAAEPAGADEAAAETPPPRRPLTEADEEAAFVAVQEQLQGRWQAEAPARPGPAVNPPEPSAAADEAGDGADVDNRPVDRTGQSAAAEALAAGGVGRTVVALIAGLALGVAAAGLWLGRVDPAALPVVGGWFAGLAPPSPLDFTVAGSTIQLPSGRRVLEVSGSIANPTEGAVTVPALVATLAGPGGAVLRWTIPPPVAVLAPGQQVAFASSVTGFGVNDRTLSVAPER